LFNPLEPICRGDNGGGGGDGGGGGGGGGATNVIQFVCCNFEGGQLEMLAPRASMLDLLFRHHSQG